MTYQVYLLTVAYLLLGSALLLVDEYGGRYLLLLRLRHTVFSSPWVPFSLMILGLALAIHKIIAPVPPGPVLLGDLNPLACLCTLTIYHLTLMVRVNRERAERAKQRAGNGGVFSSQEDVLRKTGSLIELHKRNLGFFILGASMLHFLFPGAVLL